MKLTDLQPLVDTSQLASAGNLSALKRAAANNSPQALRAAAKQFESLFVSMVLKSMQKANFKDPLFGSSQGSMYQDMYDDQIAAEISKGKGLGLADMLVQQLRREQPAAAGTAGTTQPTGGATPGSRSTTPATLGSPGAAAGTASIPARATAAAPSGTHTAYASALDAGCATSTEQAGFARALWPDAQQAAQQLGVSPVTLLAQAALETNWGRSVPQAAGAGTSNNLFGIKATGGWSGPAVASSTQEYSGGLPSTVTAQFRAYESPSQCFRDYVSLLRGNPRYAAALGTGGDVQAFGRALQQGGYATDPAYASKLTAVAGTLERALASQPAGPSGQGGSLKFAASLPTTQGGGTLQRR
jgi:flagellar protein FlgJ